MFADVNALVVNCTDFDKKGTIEGTVAQLFLAEEETLRNISHVKRIRNTQTCAKKTRQEKQKYPR